MKIAQRRVQMWHLLAAAGFCQKRNGPTMHDLT
jgi:hypothetical protein